MEKAIELSLHNGSKRFNEGIPYFWKKVILKKFENPSLFFDKWQSYCITNPYIEDEIIGTRRKLNSEDWYAFLASQIEKSCLKLIKNSYIKKNKENYSKGISFENHCMEILKDNGWQVKETPTTGDQGVDIIASIEDVRICIQCKNHNKAIGNKAVQEISAGKLYWEGTHVLVSKSGFTQSAYNLPKLIMLDYKRYRTKRFAEIYFLNFYNKEVKPSLYIKRVEKIPKAHINPLALGTLKIYAPIYNKRTKGCSQAAYIAVFVSAEVIKHRRHAGACIDMLSQQFW